MKITLIILNLLAAALVFPAMNILNEVKYMNLNNLYTEIDRAGLINQEKLKQYFPKESKNPRTEMPRRLMGERNTEWIVGYPCILGFVANAVLIAIWRKPKAEPAARVNG